MSMRMPILIFSITMLMYGGCAMHPRIIQERHWQLNETIRTTHIEQLLLNVVRLRYGDAPYFLQVSSITTQFSSQGSVGVNGTFPEGDNNVYGLSAGASCSEAPVVTWSMPDSRDFCGRMLAPISSDQLTSLASAG